MLRLLFAFLNFTQEVTLVQHFLVLHFPALKIWSLISIPVGWICWYPPPLSLVVHFQGSHPIDNQLSQHSKAHMSIAVMFVQFFSPNVVFFPTLQEPNHASHNTNNIV